MWSMIADRLRRRWAGVSIVAESVMGVVAASTGAIVGRHDCNAEHVCQALSSLGAGDCACAAYRVRT
jgi:hypothetical protein